MARPLKEPHLRMNIDLRIPVTAEQKQAIMAAVADEPGGFAAWARGVLMSAAARKTDGRRSAVGKTGASRGS
jgi:hypothetical protein